MLESFEHISHTYMYLMLTLNRLIRTGFRRAEEKRLFIMVIQPFEKLTYQNKLCFEKRLHENMRRFV